MGADWTSGKNYTHKFGAHRVTLVIGTACLWLSLVIVNVNEAAGTLLDLAGMLLGLLGGLWTVALMVLRDMHMQNIEKLTYRQRMQRMPWGLWSLDVAVMLIMTIRMVAF